MVFFVAAKAHGALRTGGLSCYYSMARGAAYGQVRQKKA